MVKTKAISCPHCGSPKSNIVSDDKYKCLNCDSVFLVQTISESDRIVKIIEEKRIAQIQSEFDYKEYEKMKAESGKSLKPALLIVVGVILLIGLFALYGFYRHGWK